jgi:hypothetical protein
VSTSLITTAIASILGVGFFNAARADDITVDPVRFISTKSRSEVRSELDAFKRSGADPWDQAYDPLTSFHGTKTRASVRDDSIASRDQVQAFHGEDNGSAWLAAHSVRHEVYLAGANGAAQ